MVTNDVSVKHLHAQIDISKRHRRKETQKLFNLDERTHTLWMVKVHTAIFVPHSRQSQKNSIANPLTHNLSLERINSTHISLEANKKVEPLHELMDTKNRIFVFEFFFFEQRSTKQSNPIGLIKRIRSCHALKAVLSDDIGQFAQLISTFNNSIILRWLSLQNNTLVWPQSKREQNKKKQSRNTGLFRMRLEREEKEGSQ